MPEPSIGIVIPVYGHPRLVAEAIASVAAQRFAGKLTTVVVIDGDPHQQVLDVINAMRPTLPIHAVYRRNGRLPAARNTGIEFLLKLEPDVDAVYFLDADNRLSSGSIDRFWSVLSSHPEAGWAYPDIGFFGLTWAQSGVDPRQTAPRYSLLRHLMGNICEAGSMVRGDLLRDGLRFDESFNVGYEDWDFWLNCLGAGHVGTPVTNSGFYYRRRTDSMLAEADRRSDEIKTKMRRKHGQLFSSASITRAWLAECSPFLRLDGDGGMQLLAADGTVNGDGRAAVEALFAEARTNFHYVYLPRFVIVPIASDAVMPALEPALAHLASPDGARAVDAGFATVDAGDAAARAWLVPLNDIALRRPLPEGTAPLLETLRPLLQVVAAPSDSQDARYAGPAGYRIDGFVLDAIANDPATRPVVPTPPNAALPPGTQAIDPLDRWGSNWLTGALPPPRPAARVGAGWPSLKNMTYMGQMFPYEPPVAGTEPAAPAATVSLLLEEWRLLPFSRFLFGASGSMLYYICSDHPDAAELASIQCSEHALAGIFCQAEDRALIEGLSVPAHKLLAPAQLQPLLGA